jgi:hypothetical protein
MFIFTQHRSVTDKLANTEYEYNPSSRSGSAEPSIYTAYTERWHSERHLLPIQGAAQNLYIRQNLVFSISTVTVLSQIYSYMRNISFNLLRCGETESTWYVGQYSAPLYQPRLIDDDDDECGAVGGMIIGSGNRSTCRKPAPVPLCPPQMPHDLTWDRNRAAAVGSRRLTAWAAARKIVKTVCY